MKALKYVFATIIVLCIVFVAGAFALIDYALSTSDRNSTLSYEYMERTYPETRPWMDSLNAVHALRDTFVVLSTGNRQHAIFVANPKAHGRTALLVHGYECDAAKMIHIAHLYERVLGYNVLIPDLYGHGMSDGDVAQMGWKDRLDIEDWLRRAPSVFHTPADSMRLVLHGISMGAATTMCVSGDPTPSYVRCFIEDCGYTSVWDEYSQEMKKRTARIPHASHHVRLGESPLRMVFQGGVASESGGKVPQADAFHPRQQRQVRSHSHGPSTLRGQAWQEGALDSAGQRARRVVQGP